MSLALTVNPFRPSLCLSKKKKYSTSSPTSTSSMHTTWGQSAGLTSWACWRQKSFFLVVATGAPYKVKLKKVNWQKGSGRWMVEWERETGTKGQAVQPQNSTPATLLSSASSGNILNFLAVRSSFQRYLFCLTRPTVHFDVFPPYLGHRNIKGVTRFANKYLNK